MREPWMLCRDHCFGRTMTMKFEQCFSWYQFIQRETTVDHDGNITILNEVKCLSMEFNKALQALTWLSVSGWWAGTAGSPRQDSCFPTCHDEGRLSFSLLKNNRTETYILGFLYIMCFDSSIPFLTIMPAFPPSETWKKAQPCPFQATAAMRFTVYLIVYVGRARIPSLVTSSVHWDDPRILEIISIQIL